MVQLPESGGSSLWVREHRIFVRDQLSGWKGHLNEKPTSSSQDSVELGKGETISGDVLENVAADHRIEALVCERDARDVAAHVRERTGDIGRDHAKVLERAEASS
jgi:hypothetical protein